MKAKFDSVCPGCGDDILEGDEIMRDYSGQWVCERCWEDSGETRGVSLLALKLKRELRGK